MAARVPSLNIRIALASDVRELSEIHKSSFDDFWSEAYFLKILKNNHGFVAQKDKKIIGFIIFSELLDEAEIFTFCVQKEYRKTGVGSELLDFFIKNTSCQKIFLEVAVDNNAAINIYSKFDFNLVSIRKNYYIKNQKAVDAYVMVFTKSQLT